MSSKISSCGKSGVSSVIVGGSKVRGSAPVTLSAAAPCCSRQAGQSPASAPSPSGAPHFGLRGLSDIGEVSSAVFIHVPQKRNRLNVTWNPALHECHLGEAVPEFLHPDPVYARGANLAKSIRLPRHPYLCVSRSMRQMQTTEPIFTHAFVRHVSRSLANCELTHLPRQPFHLALATQQHLSLIH